MPEEETKTTKENPSSPTPSKATGDTAGDVKGKAGRTDYSKWSQTTDSLVKSLEEEDEKETRAASAALGLDGKHARSEAEAKEHLKAHEMKEMKRRLDQYKQREQSVVQNLTGLLSGQSSGSEETKGSQEEGDMAVFVTREQMEAGKRVLTLSNDVGPGRIILAQDLSNLESIVSSSSSANSRSLSPKSYPDDAENAAPAAQNGEENAKRAPAVRGLIKVCLEQLQDCTIIVRCKIITATIELHHCDNVTLKVERDATVATIQADECQNLTLEFHDAPSGKHVTLLGNSQQGHTHFWGDDENDRIYHAGVSNLVVRTYHDGYLDLKCSADYKKDGAKAVGNATAEEVQFVTSVVGGQLKTERVVRSLDGCGKDSNGGGTGPRAMTERELKQIQEKREKIAQAMEQTLKKSIRFESSKANEQSEKKEQEAKSEKNDEDMVGELPESELQSILFEIDSQKAKGNEAFGAGEYAQAVLLYTLALDKAAELPDHSNSESVVDNKVANSTHSWLYPRHVLLSNRSACFLKLGHHDKALADATHAIALDSSYVKGVFRKGLALHAMKRYREAITELAKAHKIEPKNKQIKQALQFAEVRLEQEMRKRNA